MSIADVVNSPASVDPTGKTNAAKSGSQLGQDDFLKLMAAQLKNQDPFKAFDPTQFLGQLTQFSTVTGIQDLQKSFATFTDSFRSSKVLEGAALVGRDVLAPSSTLQFAGSGAVAGAVDVPDGARSVQLNVRDAAGQLVRSSALSTTAGLNEFSWDGLTAAGAAAAPGKYTFEVLANVDGKNESVQPLLTSKVQSVTIDPTTNSLSLNTSTLGTVALNDVRRVT